MPHKTIRQSNSGSIPVIDISSLRDGSDPDSVARALLHASQNLGFIYVSGHGIPEPVVDAARTTAYKFFHLKEEQKTRYKVSKSHRGWLAAGDAKMQDDKPADRKESFIWGYQDETGFTPTDHPLRGINVWPQELSGMESVSMEYFSYADRVARDLMRGFALGLDLPEHFFLRHCDRPLSRATFVYYPDQSTNTGEQIYGVGPHTDFGVLTVLCQDDVGGLQVQSLAGDWIQAPPIEGTLVINVGDLLSRWTDGAFRSTPHRVINDSGRERLSLVLAFDPNPETRIDAREVFGKDHISDQQPIDCGDYLIWRFGKAFSYRNQDTAS
jgi:isopenicillin N synthase-like dioxygenase